ncbi:sugar ABC transporter substrate-binding protein [Leucobacter ruminantium]|uniref:Sugar ABC transporter substrate-binding protein n=1 Tax=Leucobacter ruminantium TaxID=1289170 RepID=A0A939LXU9_9MICO|nr:sugar ABC transporter substrate-binding protein [Leucobacter ruminantium]MBO1804377.1 sugar ABC transporter substrate-binding protein [Leucobacter ruminantium]
MATKLLKAAVALAAAGAMVSMAACSSDGGGGDAATDGSDITIGYSGYTVSNPFFAGILEGLERGAEETGATLISTNANGDPNQQVTDVENLITQGVDYIAINPADGKAIIPAVKAADAAGIPVIALADSIGTDVTFTISQNHVEAGKMAAEEIVAFLEEKNGEPKGKVVNIQGLAGSPAATDRDKGFLEVMEQYPDVDIVATADGGWDTAVSNEVMNDILQAQPEIDAVFAANGAEAVGVSRAIESAGRFVPVGEDGHIYVIGIDGPKPAIENIRAGIQDAEISQQPITMSEEAVRLIVKLAKGEEVEKNVEWPSMLLTRDNLESPEVQEYGIWADEID